MDAKSFVLEHSKMFEALILQSCIQGSTLEKLNKKGETINLNSQRYRQDNLFSRMPSKHLDLSAKNLRDVQREIMLLRLVGQIRVVVSSHTWKPDFIRTGSGSQVARASRGRRLVLGSETNCAPDNLHGRSILGPDRDSQESCFAVNSRAALLSLRSEKGRQTP